MTFTRATLEVVVYSGDDRARERELTLAVDAAMRAAGSKRLGESAAAQEALAARNAFVAEMAERATVVTVGALPPRRWREICRTHPAREGDPSDAMWGYDTEAVAEAALSESVLDPEKLPGGSLDAFLDMIRNAELTEIEFAVCRVNDGDLGDPKAVAWDSLIEQGSDESSKSSGRLA